MGTKRVQLSHGGGGKSARELVERIMVRRFANDYLSELHDSALLPGRLAFSTDSYVIKPLFFSGGDIGKLAVCGTINDIAMGGGIPRFLSAGFILEEGFPLQDLERIVVSMAEAAAAAGVAIVTGDTKVVEKGAADGIYINTAGIGHVPDGVEVSPKRVQPGQGIILSGTLGDHGIAIMAERHGLNLQGHIQSDCAALHELAGSVAAVAGMGVTVMRDPTRGGLAAVLNELAGQAGVSMEVREGDIPVRPEVHAACDLLGFDPLYMANEGKMIAIVEQDHIFRVLEEMRQHPLGKDACQIGWVTENEPGRVTVETLIGGRRILDAPGGELLPRIC